MFESEIHLSCKLSKLFRNKKYGDLFGIIFKIEFDNLVLSFNERGTVLSDSFNSNRDYDFTVNAPEQSVTITLNTNLTDNSDLSELTITNSSILATSVVMASSSAGPVTINEVTNGEFKCVIKNTTGSQINDNSTLVLNWVVI